MATRLYLSRELRPPGQAVTPDAGWEKTTGALLARLEQRKQTGFAAASTTIAANGTTGNDTLLGQWISSPLDVNQTITGTFKGQMRFNESSASLDARVQCTVYVIQSDLSTVRGVLMGMDTSGLSHEFNSSLRNITIPIGGAFTLSSVAALAGDRIVVEIGARQHATFSANVVMSSGDSNGTDLPENETTTTANDPWVEFSQTLTFDPGEMVASQIVAEVVYQGTPALRPSQIVIEAVISVHQQAGFADDAPTTSDVVTRTIGLLRTADDAPTTSDVVIRTIGISRNASDALTTSDVVTRTTSASRTADDAPTTSESATRTGTFSRSADDAPTTSDVVTRTTFSRSADDAPTTSDVVTRALTAARTADDAPTTSDVVIRTIGLSRTADDAPTVSDTADADTSVLRSASEAPNTSETASRTGTFFRNASEGINVADDVIKIRTLFSQHSRPDAHFGTQDDTTIVTTDGLANYALGTTLATMLADLYTRVAGIEEPDGRFGLTAFIQPYFSMSAVLLKTQSTTFSLDAWIARAGSFNLDAIVRETFGDSFGLVAYLLPFGDEQHADFGLSAIKKKTVAGTFGLTAWIV